MTDREPYIFRARDERTEYSQLSEIALNDKVMSAQDSIEFLFAHTNNGTDIEKYFYSDGALHVRETIINCPDEEDDIDDAVLLYNASKDEFLIKDPQKKPSDLTIELVHNRYYRDYEIDEEYMVNMHRTIKGASFPIVSFYHLSHAKDGTWSAEVTATNAVPLTWQQEGPVLNRPMTTYDFSELAKSLKFLKDNFVSAPAKLLSDTEQS